MRSDFMTVTIDLETYLLLKEVARIKGCRNSNACSDIVKEYCKIEGIDIDPNELEDLKRDRSKLGIK